MRKKAEAASKKQTAKKGKGTINSNAKRAAEERQAKNKQKKVYLDL